MFPDRDKTTVDITKVSESLLFKDEKSIQDYMLENTKKAILELLGEANKVRKAVFESEDLAENSNEQSEQPVVQQDKNSDIIKVDLGNGQIGRVSKKNLDEVKNQ